MIQQVHPALANEGTTWGGVRVRRVYRPATEATLPALSEHYICLNIGRPHHLIYECEGQRHAGLRDNGDMVLTPANHATRWQRHIEGEGLHVFVQPSLLAQIAEAAERESDSTDIFGAFCTRDPQIEHIGFALLAEAEQGCPNGKLYGDAMATALATHMLRKYNAYSPQVPATTNGLSPIRLRRVLDFLKDNLAEDVTLAQAAAVAGVSPYHFARQFRQSTGLSPHQYRIERRIERAKQLLQTGRVPVSEVAITVGFADQSHLSRHFKRLLGTTPARFARR